MQGIYDLVGERIRNGFDAQVVGIATFDYINQVENFHYVIEKGERIYPDARSFDNLRQHLITTRQKVFIKNKEEAFAWFKKQVVPGTKPMLSGIFMCLCLLVKKLPVISAFKMLTGNMLFTESDIKIVGNLSQQHECGFGKRKIV